MSTFELDRPIVLRPHHLLCLTKVLHVGFNPDYAENIINIYFQLNYKQHPTITLTKDCDEICKFCPYKTKNSCTAGRDTCSIDDHILTMLDLSYHKIYYYDEIIIKYRDLSIDTCKALCQDCSWKTSCYK